MWHHSSVNTNIVEVEGVSRVKNSKINIHIIFVNLFKHRTYMLCAGGNIETNLNFNINFLFTHIVGRIVVKSEVANFRLLLEYSLNWPSRLLIMNFDSRLMVNDSGRFYIVAKIYWTDWMVLKWWVRMGLTSKWPQWITWIWPITNAPTLSSSHIMTFKLCKTKY